MESGKANSARMGRPRSFGEEEALDAAMRVFWAKGYEGTSLDDLTSAMGINRSSLYSSFGDKEALFRKVLARYGEVPMAFLWEALKQPSARAVVESLMRGMVDFLADRSHPAGCLSLQGGLACGTGVEGAKQAMLDWRRSGLLALENRMQRAKEEGDLPGDINPKDFARYLSVVMNGLAVHAANGATRAEIRRAVKLAVRAMPL